MKVVRFVIPLGLLVATPARASDEYPQALEDELGMAQKPPCTLCHQDDNGGTNTVVTPFGRFLLTQGLTKHNQDLLKAILRSPAGQSQDSDGDGATDVEELQAGSDPNVGVDGSSVVKQPVLNTGCALRRGGAGRREGLGAGAVLSACALLLGRCSRRKESAP